MLRFRDNGIPVYFLIFGTFLKILYSNLIDFEREFYEKITFRLRKISIGFTLLSLHFFKSAEYVFTTHYNNCTVYLPFCFLTFQIIVFIRYIASSRKYLNKWVLNAFLTIYLLSETVLSICSSRKVLTIKLITAAFSRRTLFSSRLKNTILISRILRTRKLASHPSLSLLHIQTHLFIKF